MLHLQSLSLCAVCLAGNPTPDVFSFQSPCFTFLKLLSGCSYKNLLVCSYPLASVLKGIHHSRCPLSDQSSCMEPCPPPQPYAGSSFLPVCTLADRQQRWLSRVVPATHMDDLFRVPGSGCGGHLRSVWEGTHCPWGLSLGHFPSQASSAFQVGENISKGSNS